MTTQTTRDGWDRLTNTPLTLAAIAFLAAYAWPIIQPDISPGWKYTCWLVDWITWGLFAVDYGVRVALARHKWRYVRNNLIGLAMVILPMLRPLRLLRLITLLQVLNSKASQSLRNRIAIYVAGTTTLVVFVASLAAVSSERGHRGANIESFGDAWWWAIETITTVGYGDRYPVTLTGRLVAIALMISGIALLGIITAGLASWLVERMQKPTSSQDPQDEELEDDVAALTRQVQQLQDKLDLVLAHIDQQQPNTRRPPGRR